MAVDIFLQAARAIKHGGIVLDIGCGLRPQTLVKPSKHICLEPHVPYADEIEKRGFKVIRKTALEALSDFEEYDTITMIDVIEHLEKADGLKAIDLAKQRARQVVIFTPLGFMPQHGDAWNMGAEHWQEHRSGWMPDEFPGWLTYVDKEFHKRKGFGAFIAIWRL